MNSNLSDRSKNNFYMYLIVDDSLDILFKKVIGTEIIVFVKIFNFLLYFKHDVN